MDKLRRYIFSILFISVFISMLGLGVFSPILPLFAKNLGASGLWVGLIFAGFAISRAIFMPIMGIYSDKHGRKALMLIGLILFSILSISYLFVHSIYLLVIIRFLHGFSTALVVPIAISYVSEITKKDKEGKTIGFFNISLFLGMAFGPLFGGFIYDYLGLNYIFIVMFVMSFIALFIVSLFLPNLNISVKKHKNHKLSKGFLKNNIVVALLVFRFIASVGRGGVMAFLPLFAVSISISPSMIGIIIFINIAVTALLQGAFGRLADKYDRVCLIILGSLLSVVSLVLIPYTHNLWSLITVSLFMGVGGAISIPASSSIAISVGKEYGMGRSMGTFNTAMSLGMIFAPIISGMVMDHFGIRYIFYVAAGISLLGLFIFWLLYRKSKRNDLQIA